MKKLITILILIITLPTFAQPYFSTLVSSKGIGAEVGFLEQNSGLELSGGVRFPLSRNDVPTIKNISLGKQFLITRNEADNYSVTPSIGIADYRVKDFSKGSPVQIKKTYPLYRLEVGKDSYMGRVFITGNYCRELYLGLGMKVFLHRF